MKTPCVDDLLIVQPVKLKVNWIFILYNIYTHATVDIINQRCYNYIHT